MSDPGEQRDGPWDRTADWRLGNSLLGCGIAIGGLALMRFSGSRFGWGLALSGIILAFRAWFREPPGEELPFPQSNSCRAADHEACIGVVEETETGIPCECRCHEGELVDRGDE